MARPAIVTPTALYRTEDYPKTASVAGSRGDIVSLQSGYLARAASTTLSYQIRGLLTADWTNDSNNTVVKVEVDEDATYIIDASTTLVRATHVGNAYDLTDQDTLNLSGTTYKPFIVVGISVDGRALCKIAR